MRKGINDENIKERRLLALGMCVFLAAVIITLTYIQGSDYHKETPERIREAVPGEHSKEPAEVPAAAPREAPQTVSIGAIRLSVEVTVADLTDMQLSNDDIIPLQYLTNLEELYLWGNNISDLSPLANLTELTVLRVGGPVSDITPLTNLVNLEELRMSGCNVNDLTPLTNLTKITYLTLRDNQITDISPLAGLSEFAYIRLDGNPITDWSPVAHIHNVDGRP